MDLGALTFDLLSSPTQSAPVFSLVTPLGAAVTAPFIGPLGPGIQNTFAIAVDPSTSRYTLITSVSPGITTIMNDPLVGFSYHIDPTMKSLPTFTVTAPLAETTGAAVPITVSQADFVVKTVFDTDK
jgi:hypothetical protein